MAPNHQPSHARRQWRARGWWATLSISVAIALFPAPAWPASATAPSRPTLDGIGTRLNLASRGPFKVDVTRHGPLEQTAVAWRADGRVAVVATGTASGYDHVAYFDRQGRLLRTVDSLLISSVASPVRLAHESKPCDPTTLEVASQGRVVGTLTWVFNSPSTPPGLDIAKVAARVKTAHTVWATGQNPCGVKSLVTLALPYGGATNTPAGVNGRSTLGFGAMGTLPTNFEPKPSVVPGGCLSEAVACTVNIYSTTRQIVESDIRLERDLSRFKSLGITRWAFCSPTSGCPAGGLDLLTVLIHEVGHRVGFKHVLQTNARSVMAKDLAESRVVIRNLRRADARSRNTTYTK